MIDFYYSVASIHYMYIYRPRDEERKRRRSRNRKNKMNRKMELNRVKRTHSCLNYNNALILDKNGNSNNVKNNNNNNNNKKKNKKNECTQLINYLVEFDTSSADK
jgi:hypothetical protein